MSDTYVVRANGTLDVWKDAVPYYLTDGYLHIRPTGGTEESVAFYAPGM